MQRIGKVFLAGLIAVLPAVATVSIILWLVSLAEGATGSILGLVLPRGAYRPGMGVLVGIVLIFVTGVFMELWIVRRLFNWIENLVFRIPLVRPLYSAFRELLQFISHSKAEKDKGDQVVMVRLGDTGMECMGLVTREDFSRKHQNHHSSSIHDCFVSFRR
jgi:uncharacterized membrane protein